MKSILYFLLPRFFVAFLSAGLFSFLVQIAIFRYTRYLKSPIPAQEIFGLPNEGIKLLVASLWFFVFITLSIFWYTGSTKFEQDIEPEQKGYPVFALKVVRLLRWSFFGAFAMAVFFIVFPTATEKALRYLGHGGITVCYEPSNQLADYTRDVVSVSDTTLSNNIRARLILLSRETAYVQLLSAENSLTKATNISGGKKIRDNYVVNRADYLSAGYHAVRWGQISGEC